MDDLKNQIQIISSLSREIRKPIVEEKFKTDVERFMKFQTLIIRGGLIPVPKFTELIAVINSILNKIKTENLKESEFREEQKRINVIMNILETRVTELLNDDEKLSIFKIKIQKR